MTYDLRPSFGSGKGAGADLTKIQPAGIRTKSGGARSIEAGKGPAGSGLSLGVAGVENGGRKDAAKSSKLPINSR